MTEVDLGNSQVRKVVAEMLPPAARSKCPRNGTAPVELIEEIVSGSTIRTVADLVLELAVLLTDGHFVREVEIDTNVVGLVSTALPHGESGDLQWARLTVDLSRPDWTVIVSLQAIGKFSEPELGSEGILCTLVPPSIDFRRWLTEERAREMLHEWYVQYQVSGTLQPERQLNELHEELGWNL